MNSLKTSDDRKKSGANWKQLNEERKAHKRKWKESKLMNEYEKLHQKDQEVTDSFPAADSFKTGSCRQSTVSIAVPGSILDNAQSAELRTYLVGQVARAAVIFKVDEVVVFEETATSPRFSKIVDNKKPGVQMARILQYLECPQYLRKSFFPQHKDLEYAGLLNPLACPHHMSHTDEAEYREGVVLNKPVREGRGSFVNVGLPKEIQIDRLIKAGLRVTVKMKPAVDGRKRKGTVVAPSAPKTESGLYWGYATRLAANLSAVFTQCPYVGGYDLIIGTSEHGNSVDHFVLPKFNHLLVVFGGLAGLEAVVDADENLHVSDASLLFHHYLNTCPNQGSNTIRTEEAILVTLSALRPKITALQSDS